ncbi:hypothetical protein K490DRAFT_60248 [Saccharata proteae CBS 121410]|uniref:Uncharacterized protein n=1 Tax=Saccharata proteae CBS 121410 TaxID=1314787 RepID=A0A9P4HLC0_9PEZI|nr:hypothetical protein K490DRAFT_60248 [Saccharata proteae CBS 121410]
MTFLDFEFGRMPQDLMLAEATMEPAELRHVPRMPFMGASADTVRNGTFGAVLARAAGTIGLGPAVAEEDDVPMGTAAQDERVGMAARALQLLQAQTADLDQGPVEQSAGQQQHQQVQGPAQHQQVQRWPELRSGPDEVPGTTEVASSQTQREADSEPGRPTSPGYGPSPIISRENLEEEEEAPWAPSTPSTVQSWMLTDRSRSPASLPASFLEEGSEMDGSFTSFLRRRGRRAAVEDENGNAGSLGALWAETRERGMMMTETDPPSSSTHSASTVRVVVTPPAPQAPRYNLRPRVKRRPLDEGDGGRPRKRAKP